MYNSHIDVVFDLDFDDIEQSRGVDGRFHYLYKIVNKINNNYYYGIHSTKDIYDNYAGSGSVLKSAYDKYTGRNFTKHILSFFDSREELLNYEKNVVNKDLIKSNNCYNLIEGGSSKHDLDKGYVEHTTLGKIHINDGMKNKLVSPVELQQYLDSGWILGQTTQSTKGKVNVTKGDEQRFVLLEDLQYYLNKGWEKRGKSRNKGQKSFAKGCVWVNNGSECKRVPKEEFQSYLDQGWKIGSIQRTTKGYIRITNGIEDKNIPPGDSLLLQSYLDQGWKIGSCTLHTDIAWVKKGDECKMIKKNLLQSYLDQGWQRGRLFKK